MRMIIMGQQAFGKAALEAILNKGEDEVVALYCAPDAEGKAIDPIKTFAEGEGIVVKQPENFTDEKVLLDMEALRADLCVMAYVTIFVPERARSIPTYGSICFHPSLLPLHRGPSSINWPIIWGARETGLSYFWPNDGLDEGEVLLQKKIDISPNDTLGSIYFDKVFPIGIDATIEAIDLVRSGKAPKIPQDHSKATYEGWCNQKVAQIEWNRSVGEVYNLIRGCNPQPGAWTTLNGETLQIFDCEKVDQCSGRTGQISEASDNGVLVTAGRGSILVKRVRFGNGKKILITDLGVENKLKVGDKFGT